MLKRTGSTVGPAALFDLSALTTDAETTSDIQIPLTLEHRRYTIAAMAIRLRRPQMVERNREALLGAARRIFLEKGYAGATLEAIAEAPKRPGPGCWSSSGPWHLENRA